MEQQFGEVINIILQHKSRASRAVNEELLLTAWHVGEYVSAKLKQAKQNKRQLIVQPETVQFVQPRTGQMPKILELTTLTNHIEILCRCKSYEFYILYANKEHLINE